MSGGKRLGDRKKACGLQNLAPLGQMNKVPKAGPYRKSGEHEGGGAKLRGLESQMASISTEPRKAVKEFPFHNCLYKYPSDSRQRRQAQETTRELEPQRGSR